MGPSKRDSERTIQGYRILISREGQPEGWAWVMIRDLNGAPQYQGLVEEGDVALEVVDQLDRVRRYIEAMRGTV